VAIACRTPELGEKVQFRLFACHDCHAPSTTGDEWSDDSMTDSHGRRQDFLCMGAKWGQSLGLGGKEKSILLNIKRVRKLKY